MIKNEINKYIKLKKETDKIEKDLENGIVVDEKYIDKIYDDYFIARNEIIKLIMIKLKVSIDQANLLFYTKQDKVIDILKNMEE